MKTVYESTFIYVGSCANESLKDNFLVTFGEGAPSYVAEYCFILRADVSDCGSLSAGSVLIIGESEFPVTAVGSVAGENLRVLGHITVRFDGAVQAEFPGSVHVTGRVPVSVETGQKFRLLSE